MEIELTQERMEYLKKDYRRGFITFCGFQASKIKKGGMESTLTIGENHKTQDNFIHAGLIATMIIQPDTLPIPLFPKISGY